MQVNLTIDLATVFIIVTALVGLIAWAVRAEGRSRQNTLVAEQARSMAERAFNEIQAHKQSSAERFATWEALNRMEDKFAAAVERLGDQIVSALRHEPEPE